MLSLIISTVKCPSQIETPKSLDTSDILQFRDLLTQIIQPLDKAKKKKSFTHWCPEHLGHPFTWDTNNGQ